MLELLAIGAIVACWWIIRVGLDETRRNMDKYRELIDRQRMYRDEQEVRRICEQARDYEDQISQVAHDLWFVAELESGRVDHQLSSLGEEELSIFMDLRWQDVADMQTRQFREKWELVEEVAQEEWFCRKLSDEGFPVEKFDPADPDVPEHLWREWEDCKFSVVYDRLTESET